MEISTLIIGQGICGTLLSWFLEERGHSYMVIDDIDPSSASRIAAGMINPVSGRSYKSAWMVNQVMPFANELYTSIGKKFNVQLIAEKPLVDFFASPQMRLSFTGQVEKQHPFLCWPEAEHQFDEYINQTFGFGFIKPCYVVNMGLLISLWRTHLKENNRLISTRLEIKGTDINRSIKEQVDIKAEQVIFCDGAASANSELFGLLPFALNKGETLTVRIPGLPQDHIYKRTFSLVAAGEDVFRWGASYIWDATDQQPTKEFRNQAEAQLRHLIKLPFTVEAHEAAFRPATVERRPFAGFHPLYPDVGLLNGMGSKGASLAPWFAKQMADLICDNKPVQPEVTIERFKRVLSR